MFIVTLSKQALRAFGHGEWIVLLCHFSYSLAAHPFRSPPIFWFLFSCWLYQDNQSPGSAVLALASACFPLLTAHSYLPLYSNQMYCWSLIYCCTCLFSAHGCWWLPRPIISQLCVIRICSALFTHTSMAYLWPRRASWCMWLMLSASYWVAFYVTDFYHRSSCRLLSVGPTWQGCSQIFCHDSWCGVRFSDTYILRPFAWLRYINLPFFSTW